MSDRELFVYGSLKRGLRHHRQMRGAERVGEVETRSRYRLVRQGAYPALADGDGLARLDAGAARRRPSGDRGGRLA